MKTKVLLLLFSLALLFGMMPSCKKEADPAPAVLHPVSLSYPNYVPAPNLSPDNPLTEEGVALGRRLYYDPMLSNDGRACATCHNQLRGFTDSVSNALPHVNLAWNRFFLWNGKISGTLEDAMDFEVGEFFQTDVSKLNADPSYPALFRQVFGETPVTRRQVALALAQFMATQVSMNSRFDRYLRKELMLSDTELRGFYIFNSERGDCFHCHSLGLFTDGQFRNNGLDDQFVGVNQGRFLVSGNPSDMGRFKTPALRNVALSAPFMHDGRYKTLEDVIEFYNSGVRQSPTLDPIMTKPSFQNGLQLSADDKADLLAFLKSLTDEDFLSNPKLSAP